MVEKNSGVPSLSEVAAPVHQPEQTESVPDVGTATPQTKRSRKSKVKPDTENDAVASKDPGNAEQSNIPAVASGGDNPAQQPVAATATATVETKETAETKVVVSDKKRKHKRPRPLPPIEHKRIVHYYRQAKPVKKKDRSSGDKDRRDGSGSRDRDVGNGKKSNYDDRDYSNDDDEEDDDEEELLSDSDWNVDSSDDSDPSDGDESDDEEPVKKRESGEVKRRDDGGRFAPVHAVMQYRIV